MKKYILYALLATVGLGLSAFAKPVDMNQNIALKVENVEITTVLQMIARQNNLNIVQSKQIEGTVSLNLDNVSLEEALDAILFANGLNYYVSGEIIIIKPFEQNSRGEIVTKFVDLDYITPEAGVKALESVLSEKGKAVVLKPDNDVAGNSKVIVSKIAITDLPYIVEEAIALLGHLDKKQPQIAIQVRMIETNYDNETKAGFKWPTSLSARLHGIGSGAAETTETSESIGQIDLPDGKWDWGKLSINELNVVLDFLKLEGNSKLVSDPNVTTLNNHPAEIKVTTIVPIQTLNRFSEGGSVQDIVSFQDEEIGITLNVTPHITRDNEIILDVEPTVAEIIGYSGPADSQKPITSERSLKTRITVRDGETLVMGGLLKENKIENHQKIFLLGSIPILGNLFTHKSIQTSTTDLTILITPRIIKD